MEHGRNRAFLCTHLVSPCIHCTTKVLRSAEKKSGKCHRQKSKSVRLWLDLFFEPAGLGSHKSHSFLSGHLNPVCNSVAGSTPSGIGPTVSITE